MDVVKGLLGKLRGGREQPGRAYAPPVVLRAAGEAFVHPGTIMGPGEVWLLRRRAAGEAPTDAAWRAALAAMRAATPGDYRPHALAEVHLEWGDGPKVGHKELVEEDGVMVYQMALMWLASGEEVFARNAAAIIDAWATVNKKFWGKNAPLNAGWGVASLARSAELLKHSWGGWAASGVEQRLLSWVRAVILPQLNAPLLEGLPQANWHTTIAECKGALAILSDDPALWRDAVAMWERVADAYLRPCGECGETSRDLFHSQFGLGGLIQLAEMAWHQGLDLYSRNSNRLAAAMEFHAFITLGGRPAECCYELKGIGFLPCGWEVGYNHFHGRWGLEMPQTARLLEQNRPEKVVFHWGAGTLTSYRAAEDLRQYGPGGTPPLLVAPS